jgi:pilus assembly protein CpaE
MSDTSFCIKISVKNAAALKSLLSVINQDPVFTVIDLNSDRTADVMILELDAADPKMPETIESLLATPAARELFVLAETPDPQLLMRLMRLGIKEFFPLPLTPQEIKSAMDRFKSRSHPADAPAGPKNGRVISVVGSKGGVGTTTVAVNLAVCLAESAEKKAVTLFDMNTLFGEIPMFLDLTPKFHWGEITKNIDRLDDMFLNNILSRHASGVHLLPSPSYLNGNNTPSIDVVDRLLGLMRTMFDYVIVDAGQSLVDANLRTLQHSDDVFLVSLLNMPCLSNTNRLMKSLTELGYVSKAQLKIVINRYLKKNEITLEDAKKGIGEAIYCVIPNDYQTTMDAINQGKPILHIAPNSAIARSFVDLGKSFMPQPKIEKKSRWRLFG